MVNMHQSEGDLCSKSSGGQVSGDQGHLVDYLDHMIFLINGAVGRGQ